MASLRAKAMSYAPALVFSAVTAASGYAIYYAHHQQVVDKKTMRNGVIRDIKRDRKKRQQQTETQGQQH